MADINYKDIEKQAKEIYGINAAYEMTEHWGELFNEREGKIKCKWHPDNNPSLDWNKKGNYWHCFSCGHNYGIIDFYMDTEFGLGLNYWKALQRLCKKADIEYDFYNNRHKSYSKDYKYPTLNQDDRSAVEVYMKDMRGISKETLDYAGVTAYTNSMGHNVAFNFYDITGELVGVKYRILQPKTKDTPRFFWQKDTTPCSTLFNMQLCNPNNPLYITEGMTDALSLIEVGKKNVVSIPNGAQDFNWIDANYEWLSHFDKIILWFDDDAVGIKGRNEAIRRLGTWRTDYIEAIVRNTNSEGNEEMLKDANEILVARGEAELLSILDNPIQSEIDGIKNIARVEKFDIKKAEGWYTNIKALDMQLYKGLFSTFSVISGKRSHGKSAFLNQLMCEWLDQGHSIFVFSSEIPDDMFRDGIERVMAGVDGQSLDTGNRTTTFYEGVEEKMAQWYDDRIHYFDCEVTEPTPDNILERIEFLARKKGVRFVVIDSLMTIWFNCNREEILMKQKDFCTKLNVLKLKYNLAIFLVDHPIKLYDTKYLNIDHIGGTGDITNLADYIFIVHRYYEDDWNSRKEWPKHLQVQGYNGMIKLAKNRKVGATADIEVYLDPTSLRFYREKEEINRHYKWNTEPQNLDREDPNDHSVLARVKRSII